MTTTVSNTAGKWAWHIHHTELVEKFDAGGLEERSHYIRTSKPTQEHPRRLRLMKLVQAQNFVDSLEKALDTRPMGNTKLRVALRKSVVPIEAHDDKVGGST